MKNFLLSCFLAFLLSSVSNTSYGNSPFPLKTNISFAQLSSLSLPSSITTNPLDCIREFFMPCPEGSHGDGTYFRQYLDCNTGEVTGTSVQENECINDIPDLP